LPNGKALSAMTFTSTSVVSLALETYRKGVELLHKSFSSTLKHIFRAVCEIPAKNGEILRQSTKKIARTRGENNTTVSVEEKCLILILFS
jgi:hypothetical protein